MINANNLVDTPFEVGIVLAIFAGLLVLFIRLGREVTWMGRYLGSHPDQQKIMRIEAGRKSRGLPPLTDNQVLDMLFPERNVDPIRNELRAAVLSGRITREQYIELCEHPAGRGLL